MVLTPKPPAPPVWVRFLATIDPTPVDRTRYEAGSVWHMPLDRANELLAAGLIELCEPPAGARRVVTEPLEPEPAAELTPAPAEFAADEEA